ncbi:LacI family DNA-binding transcriptional regulator [Phytoactinopolyspora mesophila]|uniref:LacI family DNA-binding transcriptional regulator n=1 Tax=Phytoactinopolyspora mesophila TaxID=2650750 RepID=A0A7K3M1M4_9ACTN|nr:LacI family DNA-binding transcriptional regulator [Phytoactinopolyspora mesophila]NDL57195.1 LacI family DNA-binding transcriptional regulator [Phytoactinopolyspora mesophila]
MTMRSDGDRRYTVKDVAARAGVSPATVSRVLGGTYPVAASTRTRVMRAVRELDYVANAQARALKGATSKTIAFVVNDVTGPFFAHVAQGVEKQATEEGRLCLVCTTHDDTARELAVIDLMREQSADAVILVGGGIETDEYRDRMVHLAHSLDKAGSRLVLCGRPSLGDDVPATVVEYDNEGGAYSMTSHLLSQGHRKIAYLGAHTSLTTTTARINGFTRAHTDMGLEVDSELIIEGRFLHSFGLTATRRLLAERPDVTAIFAATDMVAAGVLQALRQSDVRCPEDISVVGYDDVPFASDLYPALTTVHIPTDELGRTAVRLAIHRDEYAHNQHVVLGTHIVVRDSVAPPTIRRVRTPDGT